MKETAIVPYCIATVSDAEFCIGTEVLLYSFLKYNPWFGGDIIVIAEGLTPPQQERLQALYPVKIRKPDPRLRRQVDALRARLPALQDIYPRFFSFETFRLTDYDKVIYLDSDIYCCGGIEELFARPEPLLACPDGFTYADRIQAELTGDETGPGQPTIRYGRAFRRSFNAGVLAVGSELLTETTYRGLLAMIEFDAWVRLGKSIFTDQMALNLYFENNFTPVHGKFNYMVFLEEYQKGLDGLSVLDADLVHFAGAIKPWYCYDRVQLAQRAGRFIKFIDVWRELLDEARGASGPAALRNRYERQRRWITAYKEQPLERLGRLY